MPWLRQVGVRLGSGHGQTDDHGVIAGAVDPLCREMFGLQGADPVV